MSAPTQPPPIAVLVLAAGSSRRLGRPKQLLPFRGRTLLDASLDAARVVDAAQRLVTVGGSADDVRAAVDLDGFDVVVSENFGQGCSSSIVSALDCLHPGLAGFVLMLGDQPGVDPQVVQRLIATGLDSKPIVVCSYTDGLGHPFWFDRTVFGDIAALHGDKAVWKVIESGRYPVAHVEVASPVPLDVDTWQDYERLLGEQADAR